MSSSKSTLSPAFGEAVLSNCEREQIHLPGSIQPHGALLVFDGLDVVQASANAQAFLGVGRSLHGLAADDICESLHESIRSYGVDAKRELPRSLTCDIRHSERRLDCLLHTTDDRQVIAEFMEIGPSEPAGSRLPDSMRTVMESRSLDDLLELSADAFYSITGYDRIMIYQFDQDGHGRVRAEKFEKDLEPYLGQRYPASDIPQIARELYLRNRVRMLVDVDYVPVPIEPRLSPSTHRDLDMSLCFLRSMSPIHIQYLKNMGVSATLVISIVVGGELWGLVACHHYSPKRIPGRVRAAAELLAEMVATRIAAFEGNAQTHVSWTVRRFEAHLNEGILQLGDWRKALFNSPEHLLRPVDAGGAALFVDDEIFTTGIVPGTDTLRRIRDWLAGSPVSTGSVTATASLQREDSRFAGCADIASGLLAVPISSSSNERLVWFRPEQVRTDIWGGDPSKAVQVGNDPADLSPRRSFAQWHEVVKGTSVSWTPATLSLARRIGQSVADVVMHFRSVRALIVEDRLEKVYRQISRSDLPVVISNSGRKVLLANEAFQSLLPHGHPHLSRLEDLPALFSDPQAFRIRLTDLCDHQRPWRGEVLLRTGNGETHPLAVRGDPVLIGDRHVIGYVLMFTSITEQKTTEAARRRFQDSVISPDLPGSGIGSEFDVERHLLASTIIRNVRMAAIEITNGEDIGKIPEFLDSFRLSVNRSLDLLQQVMPPPIESSGRRDEE
jgi:light-regulated signal transduction histidine kinase (bacteriophytochrome)